MFIYSASNTTIMLDKVNITFGILIGLIFITLIVLFCVLLIKLYIRKIKNYTALLYQKDLDFQKSLNAAIIETQEQVIDDISQDLHDDAGQQLTYINFQIENLKLDSAHMEQTLQPLSESVRQLSDSVRSISHSLSNQILTQQDLIKAILSEVERLQKNAKITIDLHVSGNISRDFLINEKIVIYRIFKEITNNIFKHANATRIEIKICANPFSMQISDNGKGFDQKSPKEKPTLGLHNMAIRTAIIGYQLDISSSVGNGTTITLSENQTT